MMKMRMVLAMLLVGALCQLPVLASPWGQDGSSGSGGGISNSPSGASDPSLALDPSGHPVVAWTQNINGATQIYLLRFDGANWVEIGGSATGGGVSNSAKSAESPCLAYDASGYPVVVWADSANGNFNVYLKRFDGTNWVEIGGSATGNGISGGVPTIVAMNPKLAPGPADKPIVAWHGMGGGDGIYVRQFDGANWVGLAGSDKINGVSFPYMGFNFDLKADLQGHPFVAYSANNGVSGEIFLRKFDGTNWVELAGSGTGGGLSNTGNMADNPSLAIDASGKPAVAWVDLPGGHDQIYFRKFDGTSWVEVGGSATGNGVSNEQNSMFPSLVLDGAGNPSVAWQGTGSGVSQIKLRHFDGNAWVEIDGSATGGGISNDLGPALHPSLVLNGLGTPSLAWQDSSSGLNQIYFKTLVPPAPAPVDSSSGGGSCGCVGLDGVLVLFLIGLLRRRAS